MSAKKDAEAYWHPEHCVNCGAVIVRKGRKWVVRGMAEPGLCKHKPGPPPVRDIPAEGGW